MENKIVVKIKKLDERAVIPEYAHNGDVGMDFTAIDVEYDSDKDLYIYHTGLAFESDFNLGQFLFPRSSNRKTNAYLCNSVGIADSAIYRGEILFCFKNRDSIQDYAHRIAFQNALSNNEDFSSFKEGYIKTYDIVIENAKKLLYAPYKVGDRIGQMVMLNYPTVEFELVEDLSDSERGANGFGSTDNKN